MLRMLNLDPVRLGLLAGSSIYLISLGAFAYDPHAQATVVLMIIGGTIAFIAIRIKYTTSVALAWLVGLPILVLFPTVALLLPLI
jgi:hypothetical protein